MKQPNLDAIRQNDRELQALERLDQLRDELNGEWPDGLAAVMLELDEIMKAERTNLIASSQAALIGEKPDSQAELRRTLNAIAKMRSGRRSC